MRAGDRRTGPALGPALRWAARATRRGGAVTVLVTVTDDNAVLLPACVDGLGASTRRADEIVLLVLGSGSETARVVARAGAASWRIRTVELPGADRDEAWDRASADARGDYLFFLDAGDALHPAALEALAGALDGTGSDVAVGGCADERRGVTLADSPDVLAGATRERLLVRRRSPAVTEVPLGVGVGDPVARWRHALAPLLAAGRIDTVATPTTAGPRRGTGEAFGTLPVLAPYAEEWVEAVAEVERLLERRGERVAQALRDWLLRVELPRWLADAERCTDEQWQALAEETRQRWEEARPAERAEVRVEDRVRLCLAAGGRREDLVAFEAARFQEEGLPTRVEAGRVYAELPVAGVPEEVLGLAAEETRLQLRLLRHQQAADGVDLAVAAWIPGVPSDDAAATVTLDDGRVEVPAEVTSDVELRRVSGARHQDHAHGRVTFTAPAGSRPDAVEVRFTAAGVERVGTLSLDEPVAAGGSVSGLALDGDVLVVRLHSPRGSGTSPVTFHEGSDGTSASLGKPTPAPGRVGVVGPVTVEGAVEVADGVVRVRLRHDPWGLGEQPVPLGAYRLQVDGEPATPDADLAATLPTTLVSDTFRARVRSTPRGLEVVLTAPHLDDEVGPAAQQRLQRWYAGADLPLDPQAVYLQSYTGQAATDSPAAVHRALRRLRPDLRLRWGVADRSVRVPEGGEPVLMHSREWYAALATSAQVVTNIDLERWFVKRPGQRVLQTFHGYPSKTMGLSAWDGKHFTPARVERLLRRTSGTWDLLLTPTPEMDRHYREQYRYDGPIHPYGYPRDDVLVSADANGIRADVRRRLGIGDRTAVLYAPTWRDDLATNFRAAPLVSPLDVDEAADRLGYDHVLLLRGHRFHRRRPGRRGRTRGQVLDVTDYPEINDLVLAADAAVLDYSSLRFDFALTGRPMVFLVPDLDRYQGARGFLHDFAESAPGPLLSTTEEVVAALRDLPGLAAAYAGELAAFDARFNQHQDGHAAERVVRAFFDVPTGDDRTRSAAG